MVILYCDTETDGRYKNEKIINSDSYKSYLKGEIKYYDLSSNLNIEYDKLIYVFSKYKIKK